MERMENKRWVKRIFEWNLSESLWEKICWGHARKLKIQKTVCVRIGRPMDDWVLRGHGGKGMEWDSNERPSEGAHACFSSASSVQHWYCVSSSVPQYYSGTMKQEQCCVRCTLYTPPHSSGTEEYDLLQDMLCS
ncbi:hypothetical protein FHG87_004860 [Trinorchestia longiramus]|nr:hypothetical protein FHG87_004860 [Trinorchestia longiramus]